MVMMLIPAPMTTIIVIIFVVFRPRRADGQCEDNRRRREGGNNGLTHPNLHKSTLHRHPVIKHLENKRDELPDARQ
jgi:hypothetical protein